MELNLKWKRKFWKAKGRMHDNKIEEIAKFPDKFVDTPGKIILVKKFPKNYRGKEIGDIILVSRKGNVYFVTTVELTFGNERKMHYDISKLEMTRENFIDKRKILIFLRNNGIFPKNKAIFLIRGVVLWYGTEFFYELPKTVEAFCEKSV